MNSRRSEPVHLDLAEADVRGRGGDRSDLKNDGRRVSRWEVDWDRRSVVDEGWHEDRGPVGEAQEAAGDLRADDGSAMPLWPEGEENHLILEVWSIKKDHLRNLDRRSPGQRERGARAFALRAPLGGLQQSISSNVEAVRSKSSPDPQCHHPGILPLFRQSLARPTSRPQCPATMPIPRH